MPNEIQGANVYHQVTLDSGTTWKDIICRENGEYNLSSDLKERITQCGTIVTPGPVKGTVSGSGVADSNPTTGTQLSHQDLAGIIVGKTKVGYRILDNKATPASSKVYINGEGYFGNLRVGTPVEDAVDFDYEFSYSGTPDVTP